ncbi:MAG TPA: orotate phosphoribosyltransferase [Candidatus Polarisedimenticolia bacterium]|nr:orotate phosphoribosyltransferase [Candidatus Polarisedimenticolia bacterium]
MIAPGSPESRRAKLLDLLRRKALRFGSFTLASGRTSGYYLDGRLVTLDAEGAWLTARVILDLMERERVDARAAGGLTLGADPIAGALAAVSHAEGRALSAFIVRKEAKVHGTGRKVEGELREGDAVVVLDDVVTTAGSTLQAIRAVEELGCKVAAVICLVDREEGGAEALKSYRFYPLFRVSELLAGPAPRA